MTFAQRSVAGEEGTRPQDNIQPTGVLIAPAPKRLKRKTIEAVERATRIGGLGRSARAALAALARTANNDDPNGKIFKHRETLCHETGMSSATWYRAQKELLNLGLITVDVQVRKRFGRFAGAYIYLTDKATLLLGLSKSEEGAEIGVDLQPEAPASNDAAPSSADQPSLKTRVLFTEERIPYAFQKRQQPRLPQDLMRLRTLGLDENLIFWLMRKAKEQGHLLSEVVQATWDSLSKANAPKAYLLALVHARTDFRAICRAKGAKTEKERIVAKNRDFVRGVLEGAARKHFMDAKGNVFEVESDASSVLVTETGSSITSRLVGSSLIEFAKRLHAGHFKVAQTRDPRGASAITEKQSEKGAMTLSALRTMMGIRRDSSTGGSHNAYVVG